MEVINLLSNTHRNKGFAKYKLAHYEEAIECFQTAIDCFKGEGTGDCQALALAYNSKGYSLILMGNDLKSANECFENSIKCFGQSDRNIIYPYYNTGYTLYLLGERESNSSKANELFSKSIDFFDKALGVDPKHGDSSYCKGGSIFRRYPNNFEKYEEAIKCFDEAIESFKELIKKEKRENFIASDIQALLKKYHDLKDEPEEWFNKAIKRFRDRCEKIGKEEYRNFAAVYNKKGIVLFQLARYEEAIKCFSEATIIRQKFFDAWFNKGIVLNRLEQYEEAIKCFDEAIESYEKSNEKGKGEEESQHTVEEALFNKGYALYYLGRFDEAIRCFDDTESRIHKNGSDFKTTKVSNYFFYIMRGQARYNIKIYSPARADFEKIKDEEIDNHKKSIKYNCIGLCYYKTGRSFDEEAIISFRTARESDEKLGDAYYNLAVLYQRRNEVDKAKQELDDCLAVNPTFAKARETKAKIESSVQSSDWYRWWFNNDRYRKVFGIALAAILVVFIVSPLVTFDFSIMEDFANQSKPNQPLVNGTNSAKHNLNSVNPNSRNPNSVFNTIFTPQTIAWFVTPIAIVVGILLLPSLQRFKVGSTIEFETVPTYDKGPITLDELPVSHIEYPSSMPLSKYIAPIFRVPVRLDIQVLYTPIEISKMPKRYKKPLSF
jgi:tetratricopeptide (TPR) repeat protein